MRNFKIFKEGMGTGSSSGESFAINKMKKETKATCLVRFYNGASLFVKKKGRVKPMNKQQWDKYKKYNDKNKGNMRGFEL